MENNKFQDKLDFFQTQLPPQRKLIFGDSRLPFVLGFNYDEHSNKWYIYENDERSNRSIRYERNSEEEIVDVFYQLVQLEIKKYQKYISWLNNSKSNPKIR